MVHTLCSHLPNYHSAYTLSQCASPLIASLCSVEEDIRETAYATWLLQSMWTTRAIWEDGRYLDDNLYAGRDVCLPSEIRSYVNYNELGVAIRPERVEPACIELTVGACDVVF